MLTALNRYLALPLVACTSRKAHLNYLNQLEQSQYQSPAVLRQRQFDLLRRIVRHAHATVPYYRDEWDRLGLQVDSLRSVGDLRAFPILTKKDIRAHGERLRSRSFLRAPTTQKTTSGSTGYALTIHVDDDAIDWKRAATIRSDQWSGWRLGERVARLWGHDAVERGNWKARLRRRLIARECFLNTLGIDNEKMRAFAELLRRKPPGLLFGHAHSLYLFALYAGKHYPQTIRPNGVVSAAMMLHDWQRRAIEGAFDCPVTNRYGCEEVSLIACECERHNGLHLNAEGLYCEVVPDPRLAEGGRLLVTDLRNRAMPLIRYEVGDVVVPSDRICPCGRGLPLLERVVGREADYVLTPAGQLISGISLTDHFATEIAGAEQVQIVQEKLNCLRVRLVAGAGFGAASHRQVATLVGRMFGPEMQYELELVAAIPQEPSGKFRFCISPVANEYMRSLAS